MKFAEAVTTIKESLSRHVLFLLVLILFLPDYIMYPSVCLLAPVVAYQFIRHNGFKWSLFWPLWGYMLVVAIINKNTMGTIATVIILFLYMYSFALKRIMDVKRYVEMQYYIVFSSLINFFFNFYNYTPNWAKPIIAFFNQFIDMGHLPPFRAGYNRAYSTFDNPNLYAFILLIVLLVAFNQFQLQLTFGHYSNALFYLGAFIINLYALMLTQTRSIWLALAIGMIAILLVQRKWLQLKILVFLGSILALVMLTTPSIFPRFMQIEEHAPIRLTIWETALHQIEKEPLFGKGLFTYALLFDNSDAHNIFIDMLLCLGIIGTIIAISFFVTAMHRMIKDAYYLDMPIAISMILATIFYGVFDIPLYAVQPSILFVMILALPRRTNSEKIE